MKIALFKHTDTKARWDIVFEWPEGCSEPLPTDFVRTSPWIEIDFPKRDRAEYVADFIAVLDGQKAIVTQKFSLALQHIETQRRSLLALTNGPPNDTETTRNQS